MRIVLAGLALVLVVGLGAKAMKPATLQKLGAPLGATAAAPPALTNEQKLQFQVILQRLEIAKLKYDAAQADFTAAQKEAAALVAQTKADGYDLDLQTLTYVKTQAPIGAPKK